MEEFDQEMINSFLNNVDFDDEEKFGEFQVVEMQQTRNFRTINVDQFLEESTNVHTKRKTDSDMKIVLAFLNSKFEHRLPEFIPPDQLNQYLCEFLLAVTKSNGSEYEPTTLRGFISSLDRYLKSKESKVSVVKDIEFAKTRSVLKGKQKQLKKMGLGNKPKTAATLTEEHVKQMYACETLGVGNPRSLLHSLWLICTTHFGMRTGQEIRSLCWGDVKLCIDEQSGSQYIQLDTERQTKTRTGANPDDTRQGKPKAYAVPNDPSKDPVHLYQLYSEKRPEAMNTDDSPFFLTPGSGSNRVWFKNSAMGINSIYNIMNEMKSDSGITDPRITPYSARKRLVQKLSDEGVPPNQIVQISGHKNINSLNNYSKINSCQSKNISDILSNKPQPTNGNETALAVTPPTSSTAVAPEKPLPRQNSMESSMMPPGFFVNSNFHGNVSFNFTNRSETQNLSQMNHMLQNLQPQSPLRSLLPTDEEENSPVIRKYKRIKFLPDSDSE